LTIQVLLLSAVLFACRKGGAILHALGVLLLSAALALYALGRRVRRRLAAAPRVRAALAALGASALAALLWPSSLAVWVALLSRWAAVLQLQLLSVEPAVSALAAGVAASALLHLSLSLSLYGRATAAAPLVEVKARQAGALAGDSRHRLRGKRGLEPKLLPSAVAEVWQLHKDGLLLQAAELLSEIESQSGAGSVMKSGAATPPRATPQGVCPHGVTSARRELAKHADLVAEIKCREEATLVALQAFDGEEGWDFVGEFRGSKTYFSRSSARAETGRMTCRITGEMQGVPLRDVCAVWREINLFEQWIPAVQTARVLRWFGPAEFLLWFDVWLGLLYRDVVAYGFGVDLLHDDKLVIMCQSVDACEYPGEAIPPPPRSLTGRRALIHQMRVLLEPVAPDCTRCALVISLDLRVPLPQRMIDFVVRNVVGVFFFLQARAARRIARGVGPHAEAIRNDREFYEGWLQPKLERHASSSSGSARP